VTATRTATAAARATWPLTLSLLPGSWKIPVLVRNGSELPVRVNSVDLVIRPWGYNRVLAAPEGTTEVDYYTDKRFGDSARTYLAPGTVAPGGHLEHGMPLSVGGGLRPASAAYGLCRPGRYH
jgi:hypothetical protein